MLAVRVIGDVQIHITCRAPCDRFISEVNEQMIHYTQAIRAHGPPMSYWCNRYEAFHNTAKLYQTEAQNYFKMSSKK